MAERRYSVVAGTWAVARLGPTEPVPDWAAAGSGFISTTRTADELSITAPDHQVPDGVRAERDWALIKLHGPFGFDEVGVLAGVAGPLAAAGISLFAVSTFDTDYLLVKANRLADACRTLGRAGYRGADDVPVPA